MRYAIYDIDGVLADFESELTWRLAHIYGERFQYTGRDKYALKDRYSDKDVLQSAIQIAADEDTYKYLNQDMSAVQMVRNSYARDYDIVILTSRDESLRSVTLKWLRRILYAVKFELVHSLNKTSTVFEIREHVAFVVDDNPDEIENMKKFGISAYAWEQPWNEHIFPKLFTYSGGVAVQESEDSDAVDFWSIMEEQ